jgi:hypothetical protein
MEPDTARWIRTRRNLFHISDTASTKRPLPGFKPLKKTNLHRQARRQRSPTHPRPGGHRRRRGSALWHDESTGKWSRPLSPRTTVAWGEVSRETHKVVAHMRVPCPARTRSSNILRSTAEGRTYARWRSLGIRRRRGNKHGRRPILASALGMKTVQIFSDRIRDRIRLEGF